SIAAKCASASSTAEKSFFPSPARAWAMVSVVRSVIRRPAHRRQTGRPPRAMAWATARRRALLAPAAGPAARHWAALPARPCTWPPSRTSCTSLDHLGDEEEMILGGRCILEDDLRVFAVGDRIGALLHGHRDHRRHRLDALDVDLRELLDERQDGVELAP